jgi:hypothetical protein
MFSGKYGPFAEIVTIGLGLVATFSVFLLKMAGRVSRWTWLVQDTPNFMVTVGARIVAVALIAACFIFINKGNYRWFAAAAIVCGIVGAWLIGRLNRLRLANICSVPLLNPDGSQAKTLFLRRPKYAQLVIGDETNMNAAAAEAYRRAGAVSLCKFMSGYGRNGVNDPAAIWSQATLAKISNEMTMATIGILLCAVMALDLAASSIQVHLRP